MSSSDFPPDSAVRTEARFYIPSSVINDGTYEIKMQEYTVTVEITSHRRTDDASEKVVGLRSYTRGGGSVAMTSDVHGLVNYNGVTITFPQYIDVDTIGWRCVDVMNRLFEVYRQVTMQYWVHGISSREILSITFTWTDKNGNKRDGVAFAGAGHRKGIGHRYYNYEEVKNEIATRLKENTEVDLGESLWLNAKEYYARGEYEASIVQIHGALERVVSLYLRNSFTKQGLNVKAIDRAYLKDMLGKLLKLATGQSLEEIDKNMWNDMNKVSTIRNDIAHANKAATREDAEFSIATVESVIFRIMSPSTPK